MQDILSLADLFPHRPLRFRYGEIVKEGQHHTLGRSSVNPLSSTVCPAKRPYVNLWEIPWDGEP